MSVEVPTPSISIGDKPICAVVTASAKWGYGVACWCANLHDANRNARIMGGRVVPVDYMDGQLIVPSLAQAVIDKRLRNQGPCPGL